MAQKLSKLSNKPCEYPKTVISFLVPLMQKKENFVRPICSCLLFRFNRAYIMCYATIYIVYRLYIMSKVDCTCPQQYSLNPRRMIDIECIPNFPYFQINSLDMPMIFQAISIYSMSMHLYDVITENYSSLLSYSEYSAGYLTFRIVSFLISLNQNKDWHNQMTEMILICFDIFNFFQTSCMVYEYYGSCLFTKN